MSSQSASRLPLRVSLVILAVALTAVALVVAAAASAAFLRGFLIGQIDAQVVDISRAVVGRPMGPDPRPQPGPPPGAASVVIIALDPSGSVVSTNGAAGTGPAVPAWTAEQVAQMGRGPVELASADGSSVWRAVAVPATAGSIVVAADLAVVESTVRRLLLTELATAVVLLALLALVALWLVRRRLRPLADVEATAAAIAAGDLSHRVPDYPRSTEVGSLAASLNTMLSHVESSFAAQRESEAAARDSEARMRRFVADASHELRTPLTSVRGYAELYLQGAMSDTTAVDRAMGRIESEAVRMGDLVESMLVLARHDEAGTREFAPVDVSALSVDAVEDARAAHPGRSLRCSTAGPCIVQGDANALRQVLANLVANALQHTGGSVAVDVDGEEGSVIVRVSDEGPGLTTEQAAHVFDRFYRVDAARTRESGGSGLGLAIAEAIASDHGGTLGVVSSPDSGSTFELRLPARG